MRFRSIRRQVTCSIADLSVYLSIYLLENLLAIELIEDVFWIKLARGSLLELEHPK